MTERREAVTSRPEELELLLRTWLDDDDAVDVAAWVTRCPEDVVEAAYQWASGIAYETPERPGAHAEGEHPEKCRYRDEVVALTVKVQQLREALAYVRAGLENAWWSVVDEALEP